MEKGCPYCQSGPTGMGGHRHIVRDGETPDDQQTQRYRCTICGSAWDRMFVGDGPFVWRQDSADSPRHFVFAFLASCPNGHQQMHTFLADHLGELVDSQDIVLWCGTCGTSWSAPDELLESMKRKLAGL